MENRIEDKVKWTKRMRTEKRSSKKTKKSSFYLNTWEKGINESKARHKWLLWEWLE